VLRKNKNASCYRACTVLFKPNSFNDVTDGPFLHNCLALRSPPSSRSTTKKLAEEVFGELG